ncbi:MAG: hypothetical protein COA36_09570, partial [Desulfotalea sp.]
MRTLSLLTILALSACRDDDSTQRISTLEIELAEMRAELDTLTASPVAPDIERLSTGVDANTESLVTISTQQTALTTALAALETRIAAVEGLLGTNSGDLGAFVDRLDALESEDVDINTRIDAAEVLIAAIDSRIITVEGDYVVGASLDGVLTQAMLQDDFADLQELLDSVLGNQDGLADAEGRIGAIEEEGVSGSDITDLGDRLTAIEAEGVSGSDITDL